jgi:hypothetical protein
MVPQDGHLEPNSPSWGAETARKRKMLTREGEHLRTLMFRRVMYMGESDSNGIATVKTCVIGY